MVQQEFEHPKSHEITCYKCGSKHEVEVETLKYRSNMSPYVCSLCEKGIELGSLDKLEKFILKNYDIKGTTMVDFIINSLGKLEN